MQPNLKPEAVEALRQMIDHSRALTKALAALANQPPREFKERPDREYIDRQRAMDSVFAIRDAHYRLCECARQSVIALGVQEGGTNTPESRDSQHVLKAEAARPDATDRELPGSSASPSGGSMGVGQPAAAGPNGVGGKSNG